MDYFFEGDWTNESHSVMKGWITDKWKETSDGENPDQDFVEYILVSIMKPNHINTAFRKSTILKLS